MALPQRRALLALLLTIGLALAGPGRGASTAPVLLVVGDSISAGYGLPAGEGWVTLLARRLAKEGYRYDVVNASISGDTTAGGRARLPALLTQHKPAIVIIELGGNDALRGGNLDATRDNLDTMVAAAQAAGAKVLHRRHAACRRTTARRTCASSRRAVRRRREGAQGAARAVVLRRVRRRPRAFQPDRIHPTATRSRGCSTTCGRDLLAAAAAR